MGGWYITQRDVDDAAIARRNAAQRQLELHRFTRFEKLETPHHVFLYGHHINGGPQLFARRGADWIAAAGTLLYIGRSGPEALLDLLDNYCSPFAVETLTGHFALIVHKNGVTHVATDAFGAFQLFHDANMTTLSTSFLALCNEQHSLDFDQQGVYEFVINAFPTGNDTVFDQISRLGPERQLRIDAKVISVPMPIPQPTPISTAPTAELVERSAELLLGTIQAAQHVWGDAIQCPLSGGLDSRLVLGLLRSCKVNPHVYVYGPATSIDVRIAREIASTLGFPLEHFNKEAWSDKTEIDRTQRVLRQFHESDALAIDGGLFDQGANSYARSVRQANGALAVSGGCGETLRDFFFLPNRRFAPADLIRTFFSRYDPDDLTDSFDRQAYEMALVSKLRLAVGAEEELLSRQQIEMAYPLMRCRAFFGREISLVGRYGGYLLPFLEPSLVRQAWTVPIELKRAGAFESKVMSLVDHDLAALPSAYGHSFSGPPSMAHRLSEWSTVLRPIALRRISYAAKRRLLPATRGVSDRTPATGLIPEGYPAMRRYFRIDRIRDGRMLDRISTLEYLAAQMGGKLNA